MLKFLQNRDEALDLLHSLAECPELNDFRLGLAGSFVKQINKKGSPIDIVLKLKDGKNSDLVGSFVITNKIRSFASDFYLNKVHILWLDLLETDEELMLEYMPKVGVDMNPESVYTNVASEVRWIDDEEEEELSESDRIANSVTTWDEEDEDNVEEEDEE